MNDLGLEVAKPRGLFSFFANPRVGISGSIASILGVLLAVYFYLQSVSRPDLVYYANPVRTVVVKQGAASRLTVSFDSRPLIQDVTAVQVAIWNRGRQAIKRDAVLEPVVIRTEPRVPILEATIRTKSREVVALNLDQTHLAEGQVFVSWKILEQGDGGVVQLVYAAGPEKEIQCLGVIEGQGHIRELRYSGTIRSPVQQMGDEKWNRYSAVLMLLFTGSVVVTAFFGSFFKGILGGKHVLWKFGFTLPFIFMMATALYLLFKSTIPQPPFGFQ